MMRYVVDTNVPIVANGGGRNRSAEPKPSLSCREKAVDFLGKLSTRGQIVVDLAGEIQAEYMNHLNPSGQPGVGDRFLQLVLNSAPKRIYRVEVTKNGDGFDDFPQDPKLANFDRGDRKFVAISVKARVPIAVAIDRDWANHRSVLKANGVNIRFICGTDETKWLM